MSMSLTGLVSASGKNRLHRITFFLLALSLSGCAKSNVVFNFANNDADPIHLYVSPEVHAPGNLLQGGKVRQLSIPLSSFVADMALVIAGTATVPVFAQKECIVSNGVAPYTLDVSWDGTDLTCTRVE